VTNLRASGRVAVSLINLRGFVLALSTRYPQPPLQSNSRLRPLSPKLRYLWATHFNILFNMYMCVHVLICSSPLVKVLFSFPLPPPFPLFFYPSFPPSPRPPPSTFCLVNARVAVAPCNPHHPFLPFPFFLFLAPPPPPPPSIVCLVICYRRADDDVWPPTSFRCCAGSPVLEGWHWRAWSEHHGRRNQKCLIKLSKHPRRRRTTMAIAARVNIEVGLRQYHSRNSG
jgi:hypothetical protein